MNTPDGRDPETPRITHFRYGQTPEPASTPEPEPNIVLAVPHPSALHVRGIVVRCAACDAVRDWLLIQVGAAVFVRCRCTHEWQEHDLGAAEVSEVRLSGPEREWADWDEMYRGLGFDGLLRMTYLG
ncbi:hypothetical protein ACFC26_14755 [Kitasatospora purpeofusca]|uniref:hypothetical protein n=1 Tax=Kitasatospora purpeofusca TaxID=67352 RepID=UPI0035D54002